MRVLVCGSRKWTDATMIGVRLRAFLVGRQSMEVLHLYHGGADGVDLMAHQWIAGGATHGPVDQTHTHVFPVQKAENWERLESSYITVHQCAKFTKVGTNAGPLRNQQMLAKADPHFVLAFWNGRSRGTAHMMGLAASKGYDVAVFADPKGRAGR